MKTNKPHTEKGKTTNSKIPIDRKLKKEPSLRLMSKEEIEENRIKAYEFLV